LILFVVLGREKENKSNYKVVTYRKVYKDYIIKGSMEKDLAKNELIIYNPEILDLSGQIKQIQTPIKTLNPEARTIFDKGMYVAGFCKMKFDVGGINGIAYIKLLELLERKSTANDSLLEKMSQKLFNCNLINDDSLIEHE